MGILRLRGPTRTHRGLVLSLAVVLVYLILFRRHFEFFPDAGAGDSDDASRRKSMGSSSNGWAAWDGRGGGGGGGGGGPGHGDNPSQPSSGGGVSWWPGPFGRGDGSGATREERAAAQQESQRRLDLAGLAVGRPGANMPDPLVQEFVAYHGPDWRPPPKPPLKPEYRKQQQDQRLSADGPRPIPDPFPLLSRDPPPLREWVGGARGEQGGREGGAGVDHGDPPVLRVPERNRPPSSHFSETTPLLIGFTRNWPLLMQCVVSYIAAGWPAEDIYVVENTGVMRSNRDGRLSLQNPFYLNHTQLELLGVNVIITPTLLSFAQLQNYYLSIALERDWPHFFWSHMDLIVFSLEEDLYDHDGSGTNLVTHSLYARATAVLRQLRGPGAPRWANHFFRYDHLTLANRDAAIEVGGWDTHIPFYATDCDMYNRLKWAGYRQDETRIGLILDVGSVLDDIGALLRVPGIHASFPAVPKMMGEEEEEEDKEAVVVAAGENVGQVGKEAGRKERVAEGQVVKGVGEAGERGRGGRNVDSGSVTDGEVKTRQITEGPIQRRDGDSAKQGGPPRTGGKAGNTNKDDEEDDDDDDEDNQYPPKPAERLVQVIDAEAVRAAQEEAERVARVDRDGEDFVRLVQTAMRMQAAKYTNGGGKRNSWQLRQAGGRGEPFYRDPAGFERGVAMLIDGGRAIFAEKWGHGGCEIDAMGVRAEDAWRLVHDRERKGGRAGGGEGEAGKRGT